MGGIVGVGIGVDHCTVCFSVGKGFYLAAGCVGIVLAGAIGIGKALEAAVCVIDVGEREPVGDDPGKTPHTVVDAQGFVAGGVDGTFGGVAGFKSGGDVVDKGTCAEAGDGFGKAAVKGIVGTGGGAGGIRSESNCVFRKL